MQVQVNVSAYECNVSVSACECRRVRVQVSASACECRCVRVCVYELVIALTQDLLQGDFSCKFS